MTTRQKVEQALKESTIKRPDDSEIKNTLIEAKKWADNSKSAYAKNVFNYEEVVAETLEWVLGLIPHNPINEEYKEK